MTRIPVFFYWCPTCEQYEVADAVSGNIIAAFDSTAELFQEFPELEWEG